MNNPVARALSSVVFGEPLTCRNLTMVPLLCRAPGGTPEQRALDYLTLDEALAAGATEITEVSEQGSVPELRVLNKGATPVLIVDGEELVGARQNRVVNLTILVRPVGGVGRHRGKVGTAAIAFTDHDDGDEPRRPSDGGCSWRRMTG